MTVDLKATGYTAEHHPYRVYQSNSEAKHNKLKVFYGSNASGKTSLLRALVHTAYLASNQSDSAVRAFENIYCDNDESFVEVDIIYEGVAYRYKIDFAVKGNEINGIKNELLIKVSDSELILINRRDEIFNDINGDSIKGGGLKL